MSDRKRGTIALILGFGLLYGAWHMYTDTLQLLSAAEKVPGIVVDFERRTSKGGSSEYAVIEFVTGSGDIRRFTASGPGDYLLGNQVDVLYDTNDPANARVNVFIELWLGSLALGGFSLLCLGAGIGTLLYERSRLNIGSQSPSR